MGITCEQLARWCVCLASRLCLISAVPSNVLSSLTSTPFRGPERVRNSLSVSLRHRDCSRAFLEVSRTRIGLCSFRLER